MTVNCNFSFLDEENEGVEANGFHGDDDQQNQTFLGKAKGKFCVPAVAVVLGLL